MFIRWGICQNIHIARTHKLKPNLNSISLAPSAFVFFANCMRMLSASIFALAICLLSILLTRNRAFAFVSLFSRFKDTLLWWANHTQTTTESHHYTGKWASAVSYSIFCACIKLLKGFLYLCNICIHTYTCYTYTYVYFSMMLVDCLRGCLAWFMWAAVKIWWAAVNVHIVKFIKPLYVCT